MHPVIGHAGIMQCHVPGFGEGCEEPAVARQLADGIPGHHRIIILRRNVQGPWLAVEIKHDLGRDFIVLVMNIRPSGLLDARTMATLRRLFGRREG